ncbi:restriction endonuclease subunit S [Cerasicoccus fimbriatus]|uniref:restriction endonuclease subunit S n=1 Tax=Cerasicoccus fimbriatus TaxID=3014554 RepID=UPI0022B2F3AD|nr:restriction endonuclease subunit S [Cerasicoccus sp. TK19100]
MKNWKTVKLGEVCKTASGGTPSRSKKEYYEGGTIPWLMSGEVNKGEICEVDNFITELGFKNSSAKLFPEDTVLVAMYGATAGKVGILRLPATSNQAVCGVFPNKLYDPSFIYYLLRSREAELVGQAVGNAQPNISQQKIKNLEIPLPPLEEQQRIVAILDTAFAAINTATANTQQVLANAREVFERGAKKTFDSIIPSDCETKTVAELAENKKGSMRTGPFGSQLLHKEFVSEGIAVLGIDNAVNNQFAWGERRFITPEKYESLKRYKVYPGDVVITIMGTCGRSAIIPADIGDAINSKHLCCISLNRELCLPEYLHAYFLHHDRSIQHQLEHGKGSIMNGLNMGIIKELPVLTPNIFQQHRIVEQLDALSERTSHLATLAQTKLDRLDELKQSLLHQAFTGQLTQHARQAEAQVEAAV